LRLWAKGNLLPDPVSGTPVVNSSGQGGLLDVAIDPEYKTSGWIYLSYSHVQGDQPKGAAMTRIVRGKIKANAWTEQQVIFEAKPNHYRSGGVHFGCRIVFDKNGLLYFTIGERGNGNDAQDITKPNGKVHRINRDGSIPKDNPFVGKPDAYESIYTFGNRNQQGLTFLSDGSLWATEHGPQGGDELNLIRPGINYGWPVITYGEKYGGGQIGEGITEKEGMEQPVKQWTPSPALCGLDAVTGTMFPDWKDNLLVGALKFQEVKRVVIKDRKYAREEVIWKNAGRVRDVVTAPDGSICIVLNNRDGIVRLSKK
jgi:glucose/arabinose dehydrogenase